MGRHNPLDSFLVLFQLLADCAGAAELAEIVVARLAAFCPGGEIIVGILVSPREGVDEKCAGAKWQAAACKLR
jgi:hypothetical protein